MSAGSCRNACPSPVPRPRAESFAAESGPARRHRGPPRQRCVHERPPCRALRTAFAEYCGVARMRRSRQRPRRSSARPHRKRNRARRRSHRSGGDVRRDARGRDAGGRTPGRRRHPRDRLLHRPRRDAAQLGPRTRALLPVHLYGQMADMRRFWRWPRPVELQSSKTRARRTAHVATAFGAGASGVAAAFSFYPGKNLGAAGDAGAFVTDDAELAARVRALCASTGRRRSTSTSREGWTARLDTIQALMLLRKLPLLDEWNGQRRAAARYYAEELAGVGDLVLPPVAPQSEPSWHLYVVAHGGPRGPRPVPSGASGSAPAGTIPIRFISPRRTHGSACPPGAFRSRSGWRGSASRCRSSPASAKSSLRPSSAACERSSMAAPANDAPFRLIDDVTFGDDVRVGPFTNLYGCSIGAGTRIGPFVEIQRDVTVGARCKVQVPHLHLQRRPHRRRGLRRSRRDVHQRQASARDDRARRPAVGRRLDAHPDARRGSSVDRLGCGDSRGRSDRRGGAGRRRGGGDAGRRCRRRRSPASRRG